MKMPAKMKAKWLKALRSGEYEQATGTLYDPKTCGFCCLGVLQHVVSKGSVEADEYESSGYRAEPTDEWYNDTGVKVGFADDYGFGYADDDQDVQCLIKMNDGELQAFSEKRINKRKFSTIADWIEKNIETY